MTLQTADVIAFPVGVSRKEFLKTARSRRMSNCTVEPMDELDDEDEADEIERQARKERKARKAERAANRSATAINSDLRKERRDVWWAAEALTRCWRARLEFEQTSSMPCLADSPEGRQFYQERKTWLLDSIAKWREALMAQLLTPAPDTGAVTWKRATFAKEQHKHTDVDPKKIERAIADDLAWLAAHPTRRSNSEAMARSREFKIAMRQRIKEIAAARNLSDEE